MGTREQIHPQRESAGSGGGAGPKGSAPLFVGTDLFAATPAEAARMFAEAAEMQAGFGAALALTRAAVGADPDPEATLPPRRPPVDFLNATDDGYQGPLYVAEATYNPHKDAMVNAADYVARQTLYLTNGTEWRADLQRADTFSNVHAAQAFVRAALILCPELEEFVTYRRVRHGLVML